MVYTVSLQIAYAKRKIKEETPPPQNLHFQKCQVLANHYLGFNAWSTTVKYVSDIFVANHYLGFNAWSTTVKYVSDILMLRTKSRKYQGVFEVKIE